MKKFSIFAALAALCLAIAGCNKLPSEDTIRGAAESIGKAAGFAVELGKTKTEVKDAIVNVLEAVKEATPAEGQTFADAWKPLIDKELAKLVAEGKIKEIDATLAKSALYVACEGVDLVFVRYPKAKEYKNLVAAAVTGFVAGFESVVPVPDMARAEYDKEAYKTLAAKFKAQGKK